MNSTAGFISCSATLDTFSDQQLSFIGLYARIKKDHATGSIEKQYACLELID